MTKSPGMNSPVSSTKKQRSASPSKATPEVGIVRGRRAHDELAVLREQRVRLVVRERAVGLEVAAHDLDARQPLEDRRQHHAGHPVGRVDDDPQRPEGVDVDEREHLLDEARPDVLGRARRRVASRGRSPRSARLRISARPESPPTGQRTAADDLHPRVLLRVVRRRDADAAVELAATRPRGRPSRCRPCRGRARRRRRRRRPRSARRSSSARRGACRGRRRSSGARTPRRRRGRSRRRPPRRARWGGGPRTSYALKTFGFSTPASEARGPPRRGSSRRLRRQQAAGEARPISASRPLVESTRRM